MRARERRQAEKEARHTAGVRNTASISGGRGRRYLDRIPVREGEGIILVSVAEIASIVADGATLHVTTCTGEAHAITYRLKDLEDRLDPDRFVRLSRRALVAVDAIRRITPRSGGTFSATLANDQTVAVSRIQARLLRRQLFVL
jgi:two-component system LytT family response regulator